jgi:hypothetical protein
MIFSAIVETTECGETDQTLSNETNATLHSTYIITNFTIPGIYLLFIFFKTLFSLLLLLRRNLLYLLMQHMN